MERQESNTPVCIEKNQTRDSAGRLYQQYAIKTHFIEQNTDKNELIRQYAAPLYREGDMFFITAKVMSMCEGLVYTREQLKPGLVARTFYRFAGHADYDKDGHQIEHPGSPYTGTGMSDPCRVQLAINMVGLPRFLLACVCSALTKPFGKHGVFYKVCGHGVSGIDGFHKGSAFPTYRDIALVNPENAGELCDEIYRATRIPCAVMDSNDFDTILLGKCSAFPLDEADIVRVMAGNPGGQKDEQTPLVLVRPCRETEQP